MDINEMSDREIVEGLLARNPAVTHAFFYRKCFPLFKSLHKRFYTDCDDALELANEIYRVVMQPGEDGKPCRLARFGFRCSLTMWIKIVALNHCRRAFRKLPGFAEGMAQTKLSSIDDSFDGAFGSLPMNLHEIDMADAEAIVKLMPNERYQNIIRLRYLLDMTNEETAQTLGMTMKNYYNKHLLAKAQLYKVLKKEDMI